MSLYLNLGNKNMCVQVCVCLCVCVCVCVCLFVCLFVMRVYMCVFEVSYADAVAQVFNVNNTNSTNYFG